MVNHGAQFAGEIDAQDIAIIARGQIGVGGGPGLKFNDVFLFGTGALNFSGNVEWGRAEDFCDSGRFNTYLFSYDSVSLRWVAIWTSQAVRSRLPLISSWPSKSRKRFRSQAPDPSGGWRAKAGNGGVKCRFLLPGTCEPRLPRLGDRA